MKKLVLIIITAITVASCTERIDIDLDDSYTRLVVEGSITTDTAFHIVKLTKTTSYYYAEQAPGVSNAEVSISDGDSTWVLPEKEEGVYMPEHPFAGIPGKTYKLNIILSTPVNEHNSNLLFW
jgi:hypothetical protein